MPPEDEAHAAVAPMEHGGCVVCLHPAVNPHYCGICGKCVCLIHGEKHMAEKHPDEMEP